LPLESRTAIEILGADRPQLSRARTRYVYYPGGAEIVTQPGKFGLGGGGLVVGRSGAEPVPEYAGDRPWALVGRTTMRLAVHVRGVPLGHPRQRPRLDRAVERLGADDLALGNGERAGMEEKRLRLGAAEAAVRADELLERGHLTRLGVEAAVAEDVRDVAESV